MFKELWIKPKNFKGIIGAPGYPGYFGRKGLKGNPGIKGSSGKIIKGFKVKVVLLWRLIFIILKSTFY